MLKKILLQLVVEARYLYWNLCTIKKQLYFFGQKLLFINMIHSVKEKENSCAAPEVKYT